MLSIHRLCAVFCVAIALPISAIAQGPDKKPQDVEPLTKAQDAAATRLLIFLDKHHAYPEFKSECLMVMLDEETRKQILFTIRFDQDKCGGNSISTLIDRFAIQKKTGQVLYYNVAEDRLRSFRWFQQHKNR